ncbi:hypothetical protein [Pseudomonas syringae]|nr:hypothetical protein [Pseudomonas syringae]
MSNTETGYVLIKDALERLNQGYIS